ncbi:MAG: ComEA family DNA-binding protein [Leptolyngbyaceae cyanobacterium SM2_5_2]|nr:ComEA family DNA-binding protein [Leptolyngbyaceae cyanobacterium SM2_5_2]
MAKISVVLKRWQSLKAQLHPLAERLIYDPTYRLRSPQEVQLAAELGFILDVNRATVDDWLRLPGLSIRQAQVLTRLRQSGVQFHALEDIAAALGIPQSQLQPLAPVLSFRYYDDPSPLQPLRVCLNQGTAAQFCRVPGVTASLAQTIVTERHHRGRFHDMADFQRRLGLSAETVADLMHYLHC